MKIQAAILALFFYPLFLHGQYRYQWFKNTTEGQCYYTVDVGMDKKGNSYWLIKFQGRMSIEDGGTIGPLIGDWHESCVLVKYDPMEM